jgi:hypothetical protein
LTGNAFAPVAFHFRKGIDRMNSTIRLLGNCAAKLDVARACGEFGQPGEPIYDELDAITSLLGHVCDKLVNPVAYLDLVTREPRAAQVAVAARNALLLADKCRECLVELSNATAA